MKGTNAPQACCGILTRYWTGAGLPRYNKCEKFVGSVEKGCSRSRLWSRLLEPGQQVEEGQKLFSNSDLKKLIAPLFVEQLLAMLVGIADTLMVSYAGEAAVSGVSLVNMLNIFFIFLFTALASGGAVVVSQYIGSRDRKNSSLAAGQLYLLSLLFPWRAWGDPAVGPSLLGLLFGRWSRT